jgi:histone H3/H4
MAPEFLPKASVKRIAFEATGSSIGADAVESLVLLAGEYIRNEAIKAAKMAKHAGRKTIKAIDIQ